MESETAILDFWFGTEPDDVAAARARTSLWWRKSDETDALIRERFEDLVVAEAKGELAWAHARGLLARIILVDQFPRNVYRGTPRAFAFDARALELAEHTVDSGLAGELRPIERVFVYLPFEHSESHEDQERSIELYTALVDEVDDEAKRTFEGFLDYARRHKAIIDRFGRYPHRNEILGRESTSEEIEFLKQRGSSF